MKNCFAAVLNAKTAEYSFYNMMLSQDVCPSITRRYCVETIKHMLRLISPSDSHVILEFH